MNKKITSFFYILLSLFLFCSRESYAANSTCDAGPGGTWWCTQRIIMDGNLTSVCNQTCNDQGLVWTGAWSTEDACIAICEDANPPAGQDVCGCACPQGQECCDDNLCCPQGTCGACNSSVKCTPPYGLKHKAQTKNRTP